MSSLAKNFRFFFALLLLSVMMSAFTPRLAHAATASPPADPCTETGENSVNGNIQKAAAATAKKKIAAAGQIRGMFGAIDVKAQYCWGQIKQLYESIGSLQSMKNFNPFSAIATAILTQIGSQILNMLNNLCSTALKTIKSFKSFLLSQINNMCIPLPDLSLGLGGIAGLSFANAPPCGPGSVPLLQFEYGADKPGSTYDYRKFK